MMQHGWDGGKRQNLQRDWPAEWESAKYKRETPLCRICSIFLPRYFALGYPTLIIGGDELSKCSLKYEPSVFNMNTNVKDGIIRIVNCNTVVEIWKQCYTSILLEGPDFLVVSHSWAMNFPKHKPRRHANKIGILEFYYLNCF